MPIKLDFRAVSAKLFEMIEIAKEVRYEIENMEEVMDNLGIFWDSEAGGEYAMRFYADLYYAKALLEKIKWGMKTLLSVMRQFDDSERKIRAVIEGI